MTLTGSNFVMGFKFFFLWLLFLLIPAMTLAQTQVPDENEIINSVIKETRGERIERIEGYLHFHPEEPAASTKDNQEKSIPQKIIDSIKLEKVYGAIPGAEQAGVESYYSVRFHNNRDLFTLNKKYTFTLNTSLGLMTKTLDPATAYRSSGRSPTGQPFVRDESVVFSLEFKF